MAAIAELIFDEAVEEFDRHLARLKKVWRTVRVLEPPRTTDRHGRSMSYVRAKLKVGRESRRSYYYDGRKQWRKA